MNHTLGNSICLVIDRKYKANKKQICKGLIKVYTSNKKCYESGDSYIAKLLCFDWKQQSKKEEQTEETRLENNT